MTQRTLANAFLALLPLALLAMPAQAADANPLKAPKHEKVESELVNVQNDDFVQGNKDAPVTFIEYASLSCPHCAHFHNGVLPELQKRYIDTGKMKYVLRPFPINEPALKAALLIDCLGEKDSQQYYTFAKVLFDAQSKWAFDANYMASLETFAKVGGVSPETFRACTGDTEREIRILKRKQRANDEVKVPHTPHFFINSYRYGGERTVEGFSAFIDKLLAAPKEGR